MAEDGESAAFTVTVLRSKQTRKVLFLEAGKDFVDTLLSFLVLPVGTILHMLSNGPVQVKPWGGISNIFESVKNLDRSLLHVDKQTLVEPKLSAVGTCKPTALIQSALEAGDTPTPPAKKIKRIKLPKVHYRCQRNDCTYLSIEQDAPCKRCWKRSAPETTHFLGPSTFYPSVPSFRIILEQYYYETAMTVLPEDLEELEAKLCMHLKNPIERDERASSGQGFMKENISYIVTDSLEIMPSTTIRSINVLNKLHIPTLAVLESTEITITITEVLGLLQSAMTSNSSLNDVFGKKSSLSRATTDHTGGHVQTKLKRISRSSRD